jgi:hypothetical protein
VDANTWPKYLQPVDIAPDGRSGYLVEYRKFITLYDSQGANMPAMAGVIHYSSAPNTAAVDFPYASVNHNLMLVGQRLAYFGNYATAVAFDLDRNALAWSYAPPATLITPLVASIDAVGDDELVAGLGSLNEVNSVIRVNAVGQVTPDDLSGNTSGSVSAAMATSVTAPTSTLSNIHAIASGFLLPWTAIDGNTVVLIDGSDVSTAPTPQPTVEVAKVRFTEPSVTLRAFEDCYGSYPNGQYIRYVDYKVVDKTNFRPVSTPSSYAVQEILPSRPPGVVCQENGTDQIYSPCFSSLEWSGRFQDTIGTYQGAASGTSYRKQLFILQQQLGQPNSKYIHQWPVRQIYMCGASSDEYCTSKAVLKPGHSGYNDLLVKFDKSLIDGHEAPYLGFWDMDYDKCSIKIGGLE